jgi:hypothetical protein
VARADGPPGAALYAKQDAKRAEPALDEAALLRDNGQKLEEICGCWAQDVDACESMGPFLQGLGVPWFATKLVDLLHTSLRIATLEEGRRLLIVDTTLFGENQTLVALDGSEVEKTTRGGRKKFMLSGWASRDESGAGCAVIACRLFQRGDGWSTRMERFVQADGRLVERNILARPLEPDVVVTRVFRRTAQELLKSEASGIADQLDSKSSVAGEQRKGSGGAGLARSTVAGGLVVATVVCVVRACAM